MVLLLLASAPAPFPFTETFPGTSGTAWPADWTTAAVSGAATASQTGSGTGQLVTGATAYSTERATATLGAHTDVEVVTSFTVGAQVESYLNIILDATGTVSINNNAYASGGYGLLLTISTAAASCTAVMTKTVASTTSNLHAATATTITAGTTYNVRFQRVGTTLQYRIWTGSTEPSTWAVTAADSGTMLAPGAFAFYWQGGAVATARTVTIGATTVDAGQTDYTASLDLSGAGTLDATGTPAPTGLPALGGTGTLAATGTPAPRTAPALSGTGTLSAAPSLAAAAPAALSGTGTLAAAPAPALAASAPLSGAGTLSAGTVPAPAAAPSLAGTGTLAAGGAPALSAAPALSGAGTLSATRTPALSAAPALSGTGTLSATSTPRAAAGAGLSASGTLSATPSITAATSAILSSAGTLAASGAPATPSAAAFTGTGALAAAATASVSLPYTEAFTGPDGGAWPAAWTTATWVPGGYTEIRGNAGHLAAPLDPAAEYGGTVAALSMPDIGDTDVSGSFVAARDDVEQYLEISINASGAPSFIDYTLADSYYLTPQWLYDGTNSNLVIYERATGVDNDAALATGADRTFTAGTKYGFRFQRVGQVLQGRVWDTAVAEPTGWDVSYTIPGIPKTGVVALAGQGGAASTGGDFTFDDIVVTALASPAALSGTGTLSATAAPLAKGAASLGGTGTLTPGVGAPSPTVSVPLSGTGALTAGTPSTALPYTETWPGANGAAPPPLWTVRSGTAQQTGAGAVSITPGSGAYNASRIDLALSAGNTDVTGTVSMSSVGVEQYAEIGINGDGGGTDDEANNSYVMFFNYDADDLTLRAVVNGNKNDVAASGPLGIGGGNTYHYRFRRDGNVLSGRMWSGATEKTFWDVTYTLQGTSFDSDPLGNPFTGGVYLSASNGDDGVPRTATFGPLTAAVPAADFAGTAALSGTGTLTATVRPAPALGAALGAAGTLAATGTPSVAAPVALSGTGTLSAAALRGAGAFPALAGSGTLSAAPFAATATAGYLGGTGTLSGSPAAASAVGASLSGTGTLAAAASAAAAASPHLGGTGTLGAVWGPAAGAAAALGTTGTLAAASAATGTVAAPLGATGTLAAGGAPTAASAASFGAAGTLAATGAARRADSADFAGTGTLGGGGVPGRAATPALSGGGTLAAFGYPTVRAAAAFGGTGTLAAAGVAAPSAARTLGGSGTLAATSAPAAAALPTLSAAAALSLVTAAGGALRDITVTVARMYARQIGLDLSGRDLSLTLSGSAATATTSGNPLSAELTGSTVAVKASI